MDDRPKIQIRAPRFDLYERVTLYWNGQERATKIVQRWFEIDSGAKVTGHTSLQGMIGNSTPKEYLNRVMNKCVE